MALIFQLDFAAVEEFHTLFYSHSKSLKDKNNTVGQSLFPTVPESKQEKKATGVFTLPKHQHSAWFHVDGLLTFSWQPHQRISHFVPCSPGEAFTI